MVLNSHIAIGFLIAAEGKGKKSVYIITHLGVCGRKHQDLQIARNMQQRSHNITQMTEKIE
jgi:hypothetical protein